MSLVLGLCGFYQAQSGAVATSLATLSRVYRDKCRLALQFRNSDKCRCTLCAKYTQQRAQSVSKEMREEIDQARQAQVSAIMKEPF